MHSDASVDRDGEVVSGESRLFCTEVDWELGRYSLVRWQGKHKQHQHEHAEPRIVLLIEGRFEERIGGRSSVCEPGAAIFRDAYESHSDRYGEAGTYVSIAIDPRRWDAASLQVDVGALRIVRRPALRAMGHRLAKEILRPDAWSSLVAKGIVLEVIATIGRAREEHSPYPGWLTLALEVVRSQPGERWGIERIAHAVGIAPARVARDFSRHVGVGFGDYVRRLRLEEAQALLTEDAMPIVDVASHAGFYDQSHLTRCFRQAFGLTPAEYRASHRR